MKSSKARKRIRLNFPKKLQSLFKQVKFILLSLYSFLAGSLNFKHRVFRNFPNSPKLQKRKPHSIRQFLLTAFTAFIFTISFSGINIWWTPSAYAATTLTIEPLTWDFIGLDSNNPAVGPDEYLIGARVCNTGSEAAQNVSVKFVREGAYNPYLTILNALNTDTWFTSSIPAGSSVSNHHLISNKPANCYDAYYNAKIQRTSAAYNTTQLYRIEASANNASTVSTNNATPYDASHPRQLYVEKILSQARNAVIGFTGPSNVDVGGVYTYTLTSTTATAYPQLTISSNFPNRAFQFLNVKSTYSNPGVSNSSIYADACGWISDPTYTGYHESSSVCDYAPVPDPYTAGKVGETVTTEYTVKILSPGANNPGASSSEQVIVNHLILDFSGGSYHYNSDYGKGTGFPIIITDRKADLSIDKSHTGNFASGDNTYTLAVSNLGPDTANAPIIVTDTLPTGLTFNPSNASTGVESGTSTGWTCSSTGQTINCSNPNNLASSATSTIKLKVNVSTSAPTNVVNTATVSSSSPEDPVLTNNTDSDPTTIVQGPNIVLTKDSVPSNAVFVAGSTGTYTLNVSNTSGFDAAAPLTIVDTLPTGLSFSSASGTGWTCSANRQNITCTNPSGLNNGSTSNLSITVNILSNVAASVTNTASATSGSFDTNPADNTNITKTNNTTTPGPDLSISKTDNNLIFATSQNGTYTITVTNSSGAGAVATTGTITVTDTLPSSFTYVSATSASGSSGWTCSAPPGPTVICTNPGPLAPGQSSQILLTVTPTTITGSPFTNNVSVSTPGDTNAANNSASDTTVVQAAGTINLNVVKKLTKINGAAPSPVCTTSGQTDTCTATINPANTIEYTVTLTNNSSGNGNDTSITLSDTVPSGITGVTWTCNFVGATNTTLGNGGPSNTNSCTNGTAPDTASGSGNNISLGTISLRKGGGQVQFVISGTVQSTGFSGLLSNTANAVPSAASGADSSLADNTYTVNSTVAGPDLSLSKTNFSSFVQGVNGIYRLTVTNVSTTRDTTGLITVTDTLPANLTYVSATSAPTYSGWACNYDSTSRKVTCTNTNVLVKSNAGPTPQSNSISAIDITVTPTATGSVTNSGVVSTPGDTNAANNTASVTTTITAANPNVKITKTAGTLALGQTGIYTIKVQNIGTTVAVAPIVVRDTLPTGLVFVSGTGTGWSCSATGQNVVCNNYSDITAGSSAPDLALKVLVGSQTASSINNTATVDTVPSETITTDNTDTITTSVTQSADLSIVKSHTANFVIGQNAAYQLKVTNNGPSSVPTTQAVTVTDTLPSNLTFVSAGSGGGGFTCTASGQAVTCSKPNGLAVGATANITLNVSVGGSTGTIINTANVSSPVSDPDTSNNSSSDSTIIQPLQADLSLTKTHIGNFTIGRQGTYTLTVTNNGPATAAAPITITDNLPSNLSFVSFLGTSAWNCSGTTNITCTYSNNLASGESNAIDITVAVGSGTPTGTNSITNTATVSSPTPDPTASNNTANNPTTVVSGADLAITKTHTGTFAPGSNTGNSYTITVTNNGPNAASPNIKVVDDLPVGVHYQSSSSTDFSCTSDSAASANTVTCTRTTAMSANSSSTITLNVNVLSGATLPLENNVVVGSSPTPDPNLSNNSATDTVTTTTSGQARLLLVKRITAVNRNGAAIANYNGQSLNGFNNDSTTNDNDPLWPTPATYLKGAINGGVVMPGDEIEYTVYFLSNGTSPVTNVKICDLVPANSTFMSDAFNGSTPTDGGTPGADLGMGLALRSSSLPTAPTVYLTSIADAPDRGQFFPGGTTPSTSCSGSNTNGAVVVNVGTLPNATAAGTPANSYGFMRFRAKVN
ncbi:MAG: DUF11 domain-containing protein [Aphanothece sp. CMT-3BRIN-NPC111]|jgi:uncharacterized repeat protein (TIGR01451 family)|nr:DUF11 domain-containing protein [Aphanothece sp. CMT-3BRIN-NPC111]